MVVQVKLAGHIVREWQLALKIKTTFTYLFAYFLRPGMLKLNIK